MKLYHKLFYKVLAKVVDVAFQTMLPTNPRAIQFLLHYVGGSQNNMALTKDEIDCTKIEIGKSLVLDSDSDKSYPIDLMYNGVVEPSDSIDSDIAFEFDTITTFLAGKTSGLVGAYHYTLNCHQMRAYCFDLWDFNNTASMLSFRLLGYKELLKPLAHFLLWVDSLVDCLPLSVYLDLDESNPSLEVGFLESDLAKFNPDHSFHTFWAVDLTGLKCSLNTGEISYE